MGFVAVFLLCLFHVKKVPLDNTPYGRAALVCRACTSNSPCAAAPPSFYISGANIPKKLYTSRLSGLRTV